METDIPLNGVVRSGECEDSDIYFFSFFSFFCFFLVSSFVIIYFIS